MKYLMVTFTVLFLILSTAAAFAGEQEDFNQAKILGDWSCKHAGMKSGVWRVCGAYSDSYVRGDGLGVSSSSDTVIIKCFYCVNKNDELIQFASPLKKNCTLVDYNVSIIYSADE